MVVNQYDEQGRVICQECKKSFKFITAQHLNKMHGMTTLEYKEKYPGYVFSSKEFRAREKYLKTEIFSTVQENKDTISDNTIKDIDEEIKIENVDTFDIDKIPNIDPKITEKSKNFFEEVKTFSEKIINKYPNPNKVIHKDKLKILDFLLIYFQDIKNSYFVEKRNPTGKLEYRLITDIAVPSLKINIEFPDTFWHNSDIQKESRDLKLKNDGWTIININGKKPSIDSIKNILNKFKLMWINNQILN